MTDQTIKATLFVQESTNQRTEEAPPLGDLVTKCPKCGAESGDDWSQCKGSCPMTASPYYQPYVEAVTVPKGLLAEVLEQAEADNRSTEGEFCCSADEHEMYAAEREKINQLRRIAGIEINYPDDEVVAVTGPLGPIATNGEFYMGGGLAGEPIEKGDAVYFDKESNSWFKVK